MKSQWFRVCCSGKTIDGRDISPAQIDQMATSYDPAKYGARIWMEHLRSFLPDSPFKAYGDVLALRAEDAGDGKRALLAQVDATPDLLKLSADRQKVYWSIELDPAFAGTGQAYMVGLAVTDSPAALSTEMLRFSLKADSAPAAVKGHLFGAHIEAPLLTEEPGILDRVKQLLSAPRGGDDKRLGAIEKAIEVLAGDVAAVKTTIAGFSAGGTKPDAALATKVDQLSNDLTDVLAKLSGTSPQPLRPRSDGGGTTTTSTDC